MNDELNRQRMKAALVAPFGAPRPDLEGRVLASIASAPARRSANRMVALAVVALLVVLVVSIALASRAIRPTSQTVGSQEQNAALLADLRLRPWSLPAMGADGSCPQSPEGAISAFFTRNQSASGQSSERRVYGTGPVYGEPGLPQMSDHGLYWTVTWLSDARFAGPALVRGRKLDGSERIVFAGPLASGNLVTTENVAGKPTKMYDELVIPATTPNAGVWRQWTLIQGVPGPGCYGFQIDGESFEYSAVVYVLPNG